MWHVRPVHAKLHVGNPQLLLMRPDLPDTVIGVAQDKAIPDQSLKGHHEGRGRR
jgi:hypothetical protein